MQSENYLNNDFSSEIDIKDTAICDFCNGLYDLVDFEYMLEEANICRYCFNLSM